MEFKVDNAIVTREGILVVRGHATFYRGDDKLELSRFNGPYLNEKILMLDAVLKEGEEPKKGSYRQWAANFDLKTLPSDLYQHGDHSPSLFFNKVRVDYDGAEDVTSDISIEK